MVKAITRPRPVARRASLELTRLLKSPPEQVYKAWTQRRALARWMGPAGITTAVDVFEPRIGGRYRFVMRDDEGAYVVGGRFLALEPPHRLSFTWTWEGGDFAGVETVVEITLEPIRSGTRLTLAHRRLRAGNMVKLHGQGWRSCFTCLAAYLTTR